MMAFAVAVLFASCKKDANSSQVDTATLPVSDSLATDTGQNAAQKARCDYIPSTPEMVFEQEGDSPIVTVSRSEYPRLIAPTQLHPCRTFYMANYQLFPKMTAYETADSLLIGYIHEEFKKPLYKNISDSSNGAGALQWDMKISGSTENGGVRIEPLANGDFYVEGVNRKTNLPYFGIYTFDK